ncbi:hypothetical protein [Actinoplanes palleronii]|uniref:hypothetical protein n=1 Tax=Actinoplanes palleronii TaxID=113570 RepID=UPI001941F8E3|nr:hypothetical protein [Actinoplanes palleronii]
MDLISDLDWECWVLSVLLVVAWAVGWWRGRRRLRLWFAVLSPLAAVVFVFFGLIVLQSEGTPGESCSGYHCTGPADLSARIGDLDGFGMLIVVNGLLAFSAAVPLAVITVAVETTLAIRRRGRAKTEAEDYRSN